MWANKMQDIIKIFILAMTPIGELRAAIPTALTVYHLNWFLVYWVAVFGNLVPAVFLLLFLGPVSEWLSQNFKIFERFFNWFFQRAKRNEKFIKKYGWWGLAGFVAIPLPLTGAWTGTALAFLMKMPFFKAFSAIALGVLGAGLIVIAVVFLGVGVEAIFGWKVLIFILVIILAAWIIFYIFKSKNKMLRVK